MKTDRYERTSELFSRRAVYANFFAPSKLREQPQNSAAAPTSFHYFSTQHNTTQLKMELTGALVNTIRYAYFKHLQAHQFTVPSEGAEIPIQFRFKGKDNQLILTIKQTGANGPNYGRLYAGWEGQGGFLTFTDEEGIEKLKQYFSVPVTSVN